MRIRRSASAVLVLFGALSLIAVACTASRPDSPSRARAPEAADQVLEKELGEKADATQERLEAL